MSEYDNTNSGVVFMPFPDQILNGQGKINIDGTDHRCVMIREKVSRDHEPMNVLYVRLAPLFDNDKKGNDKAPDKSGPSDLHDAKRVAAWLKGKDGRKYYSLSVSDKQSSGGGDTPSGQTSGTHDMGGYMDDDEIPF